MCIRDRNIPLIIHSRNAEIDTFNILNDYSLKKPKILMHCFTGSYEFFKKMEKLNSYFSASGIITFKNSYDLQKTFSKIPNDRILDEGQIVGIDCGAEKDGYFGDHARTFSVGDITNDKQKLMDVTHKSLMLGIAEARPDNYVSDIGYAIQSYVEEYGYSVVRELVGHGIGTELHEEPQIPNYGEPKQGYKLREGMCIAIEPMINLGSKEVKTDSDGWTIRTLDGQVSAHFEHTIAITSNGPIILSQRESSNA